MLTNYKTEIKWAFIFIATLLTWSMIEMLLGFHEEHIDKHEMFSMFFMIPAILVYVLALKDKRNRFYDGQMSYKQGLFTGLIITGIVTIFNPLTQLVISKIISPDYFDNVIAFSVEGGYDTLEDAQAYFNYKNFAIQGTVFTLGMGIVTTLIVAIFFRTKASNAG